LVYGGKVFGRLRLELDDARKLACFVLLALSLFEDAIEPDTVLVFGGVEAETVGVA
jgi:hypothetical protein